MAISINSTSSLFSQNKLNDIQQSQNKTLQSLSTGKRINSAATDPAGSAIIEQFAAQIAGSNRASANLNDGISLTQVADGALEQLQSNSQRLRELAVQAGNGSLSSQDRSALQAEADQLSQSNASIVADTNFNGTALLQGNNTLAFQSGPNAGDQIAVTATNLSSPPGGGGLYSLAGSIDLTSQASATQSLQNLDSDLSTLSKTRSDFGAVSNRFSAAISNLEQASVNLSAAKSRIGDTDYGAATADLASQNIRAQANLAMQAQANAQPKQVLSLLGR
ncbi:flagellin [Chitinivorax tropicus]|uniref:Flagellin n=1 Tax=Chitinivorax tropicus TaxID=714531 RepID=A0A840MQP0_9PROT|nr:flagellin [Chitinivorax tropicus]MBB5019745.1 flagellin [Chitinivorax tropicus]